MLVAVELGSRSDSHAEPAAAVFPAVVDLALQLSESPLLFHHHVLEQNDGVRECCSDLASHTLGQTPGSHTPLGPAMTAS